ncbi:MAG: beta-galactosidase [Candidatus Hydrogenedentes bacterium]|nr:beta-galactosidase [Candidatus Hydrogenedentota bacterium]
MKTENNFILIILLLTPSVVYPFSENKLKIEGTNFTAKIIQNNVEIKKTTPEGGLTVLFNPSQWPNIYFSAGENVWNWSDYNWLVIKIHNHEREKVRVSVRIDNEGADGISNCVTGGTLLPPKSDTSFAILLPNHSYLKFLPEPMDFERSEVYSKSPLWGMRKSPGNLVEASGDNFTLEKIIAFQIFLSSPIKPIKLTIKQIKLNKNIVPPTVPLPFVDKFGQFIHDDWKGKTKSESEMVKQANDELKKAMLLNLESNVFDKYGGWKKGKRLEATGWFRTEQINGFWWLVTPDGYPFLSIGVDCVDMHNYTFIDGRDGWFEWIPDSNDPKFKSCFSYAPPNQHWFSHIISEGKTFCFYRANLIRQFGVDCEENWSKQTIYRLRKWGFNTIGSWSAVHLFKDKKIPFIIIAGLYGAPKIKNAPGYWGPIYDVFDPSFEEIVKKNIRDAVAPYKDNPYCIGYFVDNELSWDGIWRGSVNGEIDQPAKKTLLNMLKNKYNTIQNLNQAWGTNFSSWDELKTPEKENEKVISDKKEFITTFAERYFSTVANAVKTHAPNQLYMGCRFAGFPDEEIWKSANKYADVVSVNMYRKEVPSNHPRYEITDKPIIIGEFHFGATDRGMFHPGLIACENQKVRAEQYEKYIITMATNPLYVGCHWFQWADQPITGRYFDGENYNIGLVDITNRPYEELTKKASKINKKAYKIRLEMCRK